ncbi:MAG: VTT domain-containing protein [Eubacterium sp.]|nr:VTT domain-containing protein [Candidatus Colimonas fimequi]
MDNELRAKRIARIKLLAIVTIVIIVPIFIFVRHPEAIQFLKDPHQIESFLGEHKYIGMPIFLLCNIVQVIFSLPGQVFQLAGGYVFGFFLGLILSFIGVAIGATCAYFISRELGHDAMHTLFGESKVTQYLEQLNSKKGIIILFIAYLIPGMPKDLFNYVAGLSDIRFKPFIMVCMAGRLPGMCASLIIGNTVVDGHYATAVTLAFVVLFLCGLGLKMRHRLIDVFGVIYDKYLV